MFETPIIKIENRNNELYVKRDDLLPFSFGGNKVRIALTFLEDMRQQGKNCIVGYGNARSNLSRALANLCYQQNIPCHIISPSEEDGTRIDTFNSRMVQSFNAVFHYCSKVKVKDAVESIMKELQEKGLKPYYIYGDSNGKGNEHIPLKAYSEVYQEIKGQFDYIFLATGTGMTQGGLLVGKAKNNGNENIIGISIARDSAYETEILHDALINYRKRVEKIDIPEIMVIDDYLSGGYGKYNENIQKIISTQMKKNGMPLDPTYTGKAFYGMLEYLKQNKIFGKKILFLHTGGVPLYFDYLERNIDFSEVLDKKEITKTIIAFENKLTPSLSERNINLREYADKLFRFGKVWSHYCQGKPISIVGGYFNDVRNKTSYLSIIAVDDKYRGRKLATSLLYKFEEYALNMGMKKVKLEVRKNNCRALALYSKFGYTIISEASETSYYMIKNL